MYSCCVGYFKPVGHRRPNGLHTHAARNGICIVQCRTMAQHIRYSYIIRKGSHLQTRSDTTLYTTMRCLVVLRYDQSFLFTLTLLSKTKLLKAVHVFISSFKCGNGFRSRFAGATQWIIRSIHKNSHPPLRKSSKNYNRCKDKHLKDLYTYNPKQQASPGRRHAEGGYFVCGFSIFFQFWTILSLPCSDLTNKGGMLETAWL